MDPAGPRSHPAASRPDPSPTLISELYFLVAKFLQGGPCTKAAQVLQQELEELEILPRKLDWLGGSHIQKFSELERKYPHVGADHILHACVRLVPLLEKECPSSVPGVLTLLGAGRQSLLRGPQLPPCHSRMPLSRLSANIGGRQTLMPSSLTGRKPLNIARALTCRNLTGVLQPRQVLGCEFLTQTILYCRTLGHLSAVYCLLFDRTGRYIFTGADDLLVKIWSAVDGRLLGTLRGASSEITDLAVNDENTLLAAGSCDKILRVWCLQSTAPVAVLTGHSGMITSVHFCPSPKGPVRYLASTSSDGSVAFWIYTVDRRRARFQPKPIQYHERMRPGQAQMICASFSPGGLFLATGSADHNVRVYHMHGEEGPERILERESHADRVDSIQWSNHGMRFISGSKDGTALLWRFKKRQWHTLQLKMTARLPGSPEIEEEAGKRLKVTMVAWSLKDEFVMTAVTDHTLKIWNSCTGELKHVLRGHKDEVFVIECHPWEEQVMLSASHDGQIMLWDILRGVVIRNFQNSIEGQGHGAVFDCKWSPDGLMFAGTDSHGHILTFGIAQNDHFRKLPKEMFFHTDYRPLIRDSNHHVLDEQTQTAPHLMPPPFLVDKDGNPYPPALQRLVPGRQDCQDEQLVPNIVIVGAAGVSEVIEGIPAPLAPAPLTPAPLTPAPLTPAPLTPAPLAPPLVPPSAPPSQSSQESESTPARSNIDQMILQLAQEQDQRLRSGPSSHSPSARRPSSVGSSGHSLTPTTPDHSYARERFLSQPGPSGMAQPNGVDGEPLGSPVGSISAFQPVSAGLHWGRKNVVRRLDAALLEMSVARREALVELEGEEYKTELARCPSPEPQSLCATAEEDEEEEDEGLGGRRRHRQRKTQKAPHRRVPQRYPVRRNRDRTSAMRESDGETEPAEASASESSSSNSDFSEDEGGNLLANASAESSTEDSSSEYSDWIADSGVNLEPPKRNRKKPVNGTTAAKSTTQKKKKSKRKDSSDEKEDDDEEANGGNGNMESVMGRMDDAMSAQARKLPPKARRKVTRMAAVTPGVRISEVPENFRPPDWLSEVVPRKAPYYPQMGDEVMYFRQGHQLYLRAVEAKKPYEIQERSLPWARRVIREQELVKVVGIRYEIRPPRLCCLKLAMMSPDAITVSQDAPTFTVKYHDMPDVLDFFVLRQTYDAGIARQWSPGDRFRCMIDDSWWLGTVLSQEPYEEEFQDSTFLCFRVQWDNGEFERMSPWDLEPINEETGRYKQRGMPSEPGSGVPVLPEEIAALLYQPRAEEWPNGDRDEECERMARGIEQVMQLAISEAFIAPVDLNQYPLYAYVVEHPIDLATIKARLENRFYRRISSVQFDVRYVATNAETFNQPRSAIVKHGRIVTELCLRIVKEKSFKATPAAYHELMENYRSTEEEGEEEEEEEEEDGSDEDWRERRGNASGPSTSSGVPSKGLRAVLPRRTKPNRSPKKLPPQPRVKLSWLQHCKDLLERIWRMEDATPFREPVDPLFHPDYHQIIDTPMDLRSVREDLAGENYNSPVEFAKDMRLIFQNSKNYNTNKRSRIYSMTVRLSAMFEENVRPALSAFKSSQRQRQDRKSASPQKHPKHSSKHSPKHSSKHSSKHASKHSSKDSSKHSSKHSSKKSQKQRNPASTTTTAASTSTLTITRSGSTATTSMPFRGSHRLEDRPSTSGLSATERTVGTIILRRQQPKVVQSVSSRPVRVAAINAAANRRFHVTSDESDDDEPVSMPTRNVSAFSLRRRRPETPPPPSPPTPVEEPTWERKLLPRRAATMHHPVVTNGHVRTQPPRAARPQCLRSSSDDNDDDIMPRGRRKRRRVLQVQSNEEEEEEEEEEERVVPRDRAKKSKKAAEPSEDEEEEEEEEEEAEADEDDEEEDEEEEKKAVISPRRTRSHNGKAPIMKESDSSDSDSSATASQERRRASDDDEEEEASSMSEASVNPKRKTRSQTSARHTRSPVPARHSRKRRRELDSDEDEEVDVVKDEDEDDDEEEEEEEEDVRHRNRRRSHHRSSPMMSMSKKVCTRNQGRRTVRYHLDSSDEDRRSGSGRNRGEATGDAGEESSEDEKPIISISSRGRVRKLTRQVRALFGD